jgi:hypothetical protein
VNYEKVGDVLVAQGKLPEALEAFQHKYLAIAKRLSERDKSNSGRREDLSGCYDGVGGVLEAQGKSRRRKASQPLNSVSLYKYHTDTKY